MADPRTVIEGTLKYRDGKKWKPRWCVVSKLSPVADCLHLQLYRDSKDKCKNGPTKASLSLEGFLGMETGFTLDKESNTMALICSEVVVILAFDSRELLIQWQVKIRSNLVEDQQFLVQVSHVPIKSKIACGPARLHLQDYAFCLTSNVPPRLLGTWPIKELRRFGVVDGKFCFEGGSRCGKGEGVHVLLTNQAEELAQAFELASKGKLLRKRKLPLRKHSVMESSTCGSSHPKYYKNTESSTNKVQNKDNCDACSVHLSSEKKEDTYMPRAPCSEHYRWMGSESQSGENDEVSLTLHNFHLPTQRYSIFGRSLCHCSKCGRQYYRRDGMPISERATDNEGFTPKWTMDLAVLTQSQHSRNPPKDRSSMCSQSSATSSSSSGTASSDYSVPRSAVDGFYDRPRTMHHSGTTPPKSPTKVHQSAADCVCQRCHRERLPVICSCWSTLPVSVLRVSENAPDAKGQSRSPSPKKPTHREDSSCTCRLNPYVHYAVPRNVICRTNWKENISELSEVEQSKRTSTAGEDYDIPKKLKENKLDGRTESEDNAHTCDCHKIMLLRKNSSESGSSFVAVPLLLDRSLPCVTESANKQRSNIRNICHTCTNVRKEDVQSDVRTTNPDYANMRFIETLRLYENVCCIVAPTKSDNQKEHSKIISKTLPLYKDSRGNWHCPGCRIARGKGETKRNVANIYEIMSYSSSEKDDDNYLEMQPVYWESSNKTEVVKEECKSDSETNVEAKSSTETLPLRPFMPFLLPCQKKKSGDESESEDIEITEDIPGRSVRSNSLGDLKKKVLLKTSSEKTEGTSSSVDEASFQIMGSPKLTPVKKHTLLSKLTLRSKEKSFSTDEISPPSSVPSTPNNMFLETLHKYPFHKSADCVQLKENFSVSEEDLTIDHDSYHSRDSEGRPVIKRSSSAPCKPNTKIKSNSCDSGISTTLSRRVETGEDNKYSTEEGNMVSTDLKLSSGNADQVQQSCCHVQAKGLEGTSKALLVTECRRCHHFLTSPEHFLLLDTGATASSSSSSDISDYIETLSLCSRSSSSSGSSDYMRAADVFGTKGPVFCTSALRPRSGKEYHMVDRLTLHDTGQFVLATHDKTCPNCEAQDTADVKEGTSCKTNSPSPGYVSSSPGNLECVCSPSSQHHFVFPKDDKELNYLQVNVEDQESSGEIQKYGMVQYAVIDVLATTAAQKLCTERAHERQEATEEENNP